MPLQSLHVNLQEILPAESHHPGFLVTAGSSVVLSLHGGVLFSLHVELQPLPLRPGLLALQLSVGQAHLALRLPPRWHRLVPHLTVSDLIS